MICAVRLLREPSGLCGECAERACSLWDATRNQCSINTFLQGPTETQKLVTNLFEQMKELYPD